MANVLLITNYFESGIHVTTIDKSYLYPLGILSISTRLEECGHNVRVIDLNVENCSEASILQIIRAEVIDLVCFTAYTENAKTVLKIAKVIKQVKPEMKIMVGGPHVTLDPKYCIRSRYIDYESVGEGESTILELAEAIDSNETVIAIKNIKSLVYRNNREIVENERFPFMTDLDLLPIIKRTYVTPLYTGLLNIATSRGCPGRCIYCSASFLSGSKYRVRGIENVYMECMYYSANFNEVTREIYIVDDTFTALRKRVNIFLDYIEMFGTTFHWSCESRIDVMNQELIDRMAKSGCFDIQFGIESGCQEVLDGIRKHINLEQARKIIKYTYDSGMVVTMSFMLGHFCDTLETLKMTRNFIKEMYDNYGDQTNMAVSFNTPFPGTWQYEHRDEIGLRLIDTSFDSMTLLTPIVETNNFTKSDLLKMYSECYPYTSVGRKS